MSLQSDVEALARALGVRRGGYGDDPLARGQTISLHWITGAFVLTLDSGARRVDPPTAAIILLGHARGLRVDIGECPACRERGSKRGLAMWEWRQWKNGGVGWPGILPDHVAKDGRLGPHPWKVVCADGRGRVWQRARRPCPTCVIDGKPTGRHLLPWGQAILDAMPKVSWVRREGVDHGPFETPGDPATRTALTVLADQAQARGDKLGDVLAWWLAGPDMLGQHEAELRSIVLAARLTFEMSNFSPASDTLGQAAPGV